MANQPKTGPTRAVADTNVDRYPSIRETLAVVSSRMPDQDAPVERIEVTTLASGEATYRVWLARALEPETGYISQV